MGIRIRKVLGYGLTNFDSIKTKPGWEDRFFDSEFKDLTGYVQKYIKDNNLDMNVGSNPTRRTNYIKGSINGLLVNRRRKDC